MLFLGGKNWIFLGLCGIKLWGGNNKEDKIDMHMLCSCLFSTMTSTALESSRMFLSWFCHLAGIGRMEQMKENSVYILWFGNMQMRLIHSVKRMMKRLIAISSIGGKQTSLILFELWPSRSARLSVLCDGRGGSTSSSAHSQPWLWCQGDVALVNSLVAPGDWLQHSSLWSSVFWDWDKVLIFFLPGIGTDRRTFNLLS